MRQAGYDGARPGKPDSKEVEVTKSRVVRLLAWAVLALLLTWLLAWLALPPLLKWQLQTRGSELLGRELRVGDVRFVPMTLQLTLRDLALAAADASAPPQVQIDRLYVDFDARSLLRFAPVVAALEIDAPRLRVRRLADGGLDIDDLLQRFASAPDKPADPPEAPARFALFNLRVVDGGLRFDDQRVGREHVLRDLRLDLPFLSSLNDHVQVKVEPRLAFDLDGSRFDSHGSSTPFAEGRASQLQLRFDAWALQPLWAYLPQDLPLQPAGGQLSVDLALQFEQPSAQPPRVQLQGWLELADLALRPRDDTPLLGLRKLRVQLQDLHLLQRRAVIEAVQIDGAQLQLRREASGLLELQRLAQSIAPSSTASPASATAVPPPWQLQLRQLQLTDAQIHWSDATLQPPAQARLQGIELQLQDLHWPFDADAKLRLDAALHAQGKDQGRLHAQGSFTDRHAKLALQLAEVDAALAEPYLRQWLQPQLRAKLNAAATLDWARGDAPRLLLGVPSLRIDALELADSAKGGPELKLSRLELRELQADLLQRHVTVDGVLAQRPTASLSRDASGAFDIQRWLLDKPAVSGGDGQADGQTDAGVAGPDAAPPWRFTLRDLQVDGGSVRFADAALPGGPLQLSGVRLSAQALAWPAADAPVALQLAAGLHAGKAGSATDAARLDWNGKVAPQPLSAQGRLRVERFPVHVFEPYFGGALPVSLQRLEGGFNGQLQLRQQTKGLSARLQGDALLADLRLASRDAATELLSWNALQLDRLDFALQPGSKPRVQIGELKLTDFFARLEVDETGRFNLQTVAAAPTTAAQPASKVSSSSSSSSSFSMPIELLIESTQFSNGRVDFNDRFVRPNYRADLTELNGQVGRLDSRVTDMATVQLRGRVAGTGSLAIDGALNPTVMPPVLDIKARASDIDLPGLTPYAAKYAGYPIERGKLSMNVAYKVQPDGKLEASNQIIVNQLTLGAKTDSPDATSLPVPLLVALLQDKNGVIDLDLPLSGSLDDPQFSLGALIWKVIVNLFTKIVSSPFAALGGGGKDLSHVEFRAGTAVLSAGGEEVITKVAKALADRPKLELGIVAQVDAQSEADAMRHAAFETRLIDEQRRDRARGALGSTGLDAPLPPLNDEQRARLVRRIYDDTPLPDKPRNFIGLTKNIPLAEMQERLVAATPIDDAAARQLALQRGRVVRDALIAKGLGSERLFLGEPKLRAAQTDNAPWVPQAQLTLSVN